MLANFKFYNVGQGTFYGGSIENDQSEFVIVYDCGSVTKGSPLVKPIQEFKSRFDKIDLLVVSHFDKDHVNGLPGLLQKMDVGLVVLPYMPIFKRLALMTGYNNDEITNDYSSFLSSPTRFLNDEKYNVNEIIYVEQGENEEGQEFPNGPEDPKNNPELTVEDNALNLGDIENNAEVEDKLKPEIDELKDANVKFQSYNFQLLLNRNIWEFLFYHRKTKNEEDIAIFQKSLLNYMKKKNISRSELFIEKHRREIHKIYKNTINKNINYSSLCLYHGPLERSMVLHSDSAYYNCKLMCIYDILSSDCYRKTGTILSGDQFLKTKNDFDSFYYYFETRMDNICTFQVPHHGSRYNWNYLPNQLSKHRICNYVINFGSTRKKHPSKDVLKNLINFAKCNIVLNDEHNCFEYIIT